MENVEPTLIFTEMVTEAMRRYEVYYPLVNGVMLQLKNKTATDLYTIGKRRLKQTTYIYNYIYMTPGLEISCSLSFIFPMCLQHAAL